MTKDSSNAFGNTCVNISLTFFHFSAFNPKSTLYVRNKYKKKLEEFQQSCELIKYLGSNMTKRYRDPSERPIDFDHKMGRFLSLQGAPPIEGWMR